jgi:uncharacterized membrane-anchored protein
MKNKSQRKSWWQEHSLSLVSILILICWILAYITSDPAKHWGSFFGNAIADWSGVVVTVIATKYFYEVGSTESRPPPGAFTRLRGVLLKHSLSIFLVATGIGWIILFAHTNPQARWGQVIGNIVSEWTQIFGMVILTKRLVEQHSKESHDK